MNKTIIININGIIFHIEEDAYDILKNYMTGVKKHFANTDDSFEITTDIENRIAEMFSELCDQFMLKRNYAKSIAGLSIRILTKFTAVTCLQFINTNNGKRVCKMKFLSTNIHNLYKNL